jgi:carboxyl-terminal processing protease
MNIRLLLGLALHLAVASLLTAQSNPPTAPAAAPSVEVGPLSGKYTNTLTLAPEEENGGIAMLASRMIERSHFLRKKFDDSISERFFDRYLESLDPQRMYFLESDVTEFSPLRLELDDLTARRGDTQPGYDIFNRFLLRVDQQYAWVQELLKTEKFVFDTDEKFLLNRKEAARPANLEAARKIWRDRLRFEYLAEKLSKPELPVLASNVWSKILSATNTAPAVVDGKPIPDITPSAVEVSLHGILSTNRAAEFSALYKNGTLKSAADVEARLASGGLAAERHDEVVKTLTRRYNRTLRNLKQFDAAEVLDWYLDAMAHAYDPHTDYLGKREAENFAMQMRLSLFGIGATLTSEDGYTTIREVKAGSPAEKSKQIKAGDRIVAVAQDNAAPVDVIEERLDKVVQQIRGPKGTKVTLTLIPEGADSSVRKTVTIVRDEIKLEDMAAKAQIIDLPAGNGRTNRLGVIDLPSFYSGAVAGGRNNTSPTADVARLLKKLMAEKVDGVILDLRRNGGGSLEECVNLTGLFIKSGPVVQVVNQVGQKRVLEDEDSDVLYGGPLMVMTSRFSASASEILAGALQDYGRAIVVGDASTHGKGTVQNLQPLSPYYRGSNDPGEVKVTISKFYRATGASTQLRGVVPDIVLPSIYNYAEVGEGSLSNALAYDVIPPARFEKLALTETALPELTKRSEDRIKTDRDFSYIRDDIDRYRKQLEDRTVSLNESTRRRELASDKARAEARKAEIKARNERAPLTYEITLRDADKPGLPEPKNSKSVAAGSKRDERAPGAAANESAAAGHAAKKPAADDDDPAAEPEDTGGPTDVYLREAERIMLDYLEVSPSRRGVALKD